MGKDADAREMEKRCKAIWKKVQGNRRKGAGLFFCRAAAPRAESGCLCAEDALLFANFAADF
jgi:hypothetical protein